jgi:predicted outer membrane repeat protein
VASGRGGGFYSAGQLNLVTVTVSRNQANHGGAIFSSHSGNNHYCSVSSPQDFTYSFIDNNTVSAGGAYGIIDWDGIATTAKCVMGQNRVEASGNSSPACASQSCNPNCPQYPFSP